MSDQKTRYEISADELNNRMERQARFHEEPIQRAVAVLEAGLEKVIASLGVDMTKGDESIRLQQELLGIENRTLEGYPGVFVLVNKSGEPAPYAWISDAILRSDGTYHYEIHWFQKDKLEVMGGIKIL